eukprot:15341576-Alexandrium_andersonii.AAC.1
MEVSPSSPGSVPGRWSGAVQALQPRHGGPQRLWAMGQQPAGDGRGALGQEGANLELDSAATPGRPAPH